MPNDDAPTAGDGSTPDERARRELQSVLAQMHGLMNVAIDNRGRWREPDDVLEDPFPAAYAAASVAFGQINAALNSGDYDNKLAGAGLAGASFEPKKRASGSASRS